MFVALRIVTLRRADDAAALAAALGRAATRLSAIRASWAAPTLPGAGINAGHIVWRAVVDSEAAALALPDDPAWRDAVAPLLAAGTVQSLGYRQAHSGGPGGTARIWRALVFATMPHAAPQRVRALQAATLLMPEHVRSIRRFALSSIAHGDGPKRFGLVWEQEFSDLTGLVGEYMTHPIHWGVVDAFFDADCPDYIVDPHLMQLVCAIDGPVI